MINRSHILLVLFIYSFVCNAQSISVSSFKLLDTDLTANTAGTMEMDQNGETAALIKVVTTQTGFTFDGGALGIVKTVQKPSEIWVYVPRGLKKISISHPQLGMLRDYYLNVPIEAARTYEMILVAGEVQTVVKQARTSQYIVFQLTPPNAVVELDGELIETNGGIATKMMKLGTYSYRVQAPNYFPEAGSVTIDDLENKKIVSISLRPNFAQVTVNVDNNAEIWVNGEKKGNGSWTGNLGAGTYEFEAKKAGHRNSFMTRDIEVLSGPQIIQLSSPTPIYGDANINSVPAMADIFIDNKKFGQTPMILSKLLIGDHTLIIKKQGYSDSKSTISIKENETAYYEVLLDSIHIDDNKTISTIPEDVDKTLIKTGKKTHDGGDYYGELKSGKPDGYGKAVYKNGNQYEGYYVKGKRQGYGVYIFADGERYEGEWYQDLQHGKGTYYFNNNNRYEGMWDHDYQQGEGTMFYFNGDKYVGEWLKDRRSGKGTYYYASGPYYRGQWANDKRNGKGLFDWGDGASYDGNWKENKRSGNGTFTFSDGDIYIGQWTDDEMDGRGIYKFKNGDVYEGDYSNGARTGSGTFKYANGDKYTGQFYNGKKQGQGTFVWKNGDIYIGQWKNDKADGRGKLTKNGGEIFEGNFRDGQPINAN